MSHYGNYKHVRCHPEPRCPTANPGAGQGNATEEAVDTSSQARNFRALSL
jgi:hypothetical protein